MNELALFAGVGGGLLASRLLGHRVVCAVEIDRYRRSVLIARQMDGSLPPFPIWDDVRTFDGLPWRGRIDLVSGGFPCQAYSSAARGRNIADDLWPEMRRIVAETAPRYVFAENVSRKAIDAAADDLVAMGYSVRCLPLSAADLGGDHLRRRYWLRAHADGNRELHVPFDDEVARLSRVCEGVWAAEPDQRGVAYGLADRLDRVSAVGEGQVACVAYAAWRLLGATLT